MSISARVHTGPDRFFTELPARLPPNDKHMGPGCTSSCLPLSGTHTGPAAHPALRLSARCSGVRCPPSAQAADRLAQKLVLQPHVPAGFQQVESGDSPPLPVQAHKAYPIPIQDGQKGAAIFRRLGQALGQCPFQGRYHRLRLFPGSRWALKPSGRWCCHSEIHK